MRLIDADAIPYRDELKRLSVLDHDKYITAETLEYMLEHAPTVDAVPVVHGHWKKHRMMSMYDNCSETWHKCSECEYDTRHDTPYCPMCGARMDEVTE